MSDPINPADYEQYTRPEIGDNAFRVLNDLAVEQLEAVAEIARLESELTNAKERLADIAERRLPEHMESIGLKEFTLSTGFKIAIGERTHASIPKAVRPRAFEWFRSNGHGALVKRKLSLTFGKGEDKKAEEVLKKLRGHEVDDDTSIHNQTLQAFVREQLETGKPLPAELISVHRVKVAEVSHKE